MAAIRIGQGYDSHVLVEKRKFLIGGVEIPFELGALGHSDGDCLLHAVIDSILGAQALGDIGVWFSDKDPQFKDISSAELLKRVMDSQKLKPFKVVNFDMTVFLNQPKLKDHHSAIRESVAQLTHCPVDVVNLKAKTWEGIQHPQPLIAASVSTLIELV